MRLEFTNQKGVFDLDIKKKYPLVWHEDEKGKVVDEFYISPVKGSVEITGDIVVDTGDLCIADVLRLVRAIEKMDKAEREKLRAGLEQVA